jgi:hypothetical protein
VDIYIEVVVDGEENGRRRDFCNGFYSLVRILLLQVELGLVGAEDQVNDEDDEEGEEDDGQEEAAALAVELSFVALAPAAAALVPAAVLHRHGRSMLH